MKKDKQQPPPKFDEEEFRKTVAKSLKGPGRIKMKDLKRKKPGSEK